jgi:hypothetical protein
VSWAWDDNATPTRDASAADEDSRQRIEGRLLMIDELWLCMAQTHTYD